MNKLILGTANFGMDYGIACGKKLSKEQAFTILDFALENNFYGVDTAQAYGDAEKIIGEYFSKRNRGLKVITKLPKKEYLGYKDIKQTVLKSLEALNVSKIDHLLLHSFETYKSHRELITDSLYLLREEGLVEGFGISVYHPWEVLEFLDLFGGGFSVEFPINIFDRRFIPYLEGWKRENITLFARSIFLQGLFFLPEEKLTGIFEKVKDKVRKLKRLSIESGLNVACLCLAFVLEQPVDFIIVGVDSLAQLREIVECANKPKITFNWEGLEVVDKDIILPYRWR